MTIFKNYDLTKLNTFGISAKAKLFVELKSEEDLKELFSMPEFKENNKLFLGGGSNILFTKDFNGIVILNKIKGIEILEENNQDVLIKAMSGEIWHDLVGYSVELLYWGMENLSLVPGTVGAVPMQNIGAYGAEVKDIIENIEAYEIKTGIKKVFSNIECKFGYRDSIFKNTEKDKYFILAVTFKLSKISKPNLSYKILKEYLENLPMEAGNNIEVKSSKASPIELQPRDISDAVIDIRRSKLPDPKVIANAGSFFKNVFVSKEEFENLIIKYPELPYFKEDSSVQEGEIIKIPAGWLIEKTGWKGKRTGNVGVHDKQALVLVNHGGATGQEIKDLSEQIIKSVFDKFGIILIPEVNLI